MINYVLNFTIIPFFIHKIKSSYRESYSFLLRTIVLIFMIKNDHLIVAIKKSRYKYTHFINKLKDCSFFSFSYQHLTQFKKI